MQAYFYSDSQLKYHKTILTPYIMIHYTKRPFKKPNAGLLSIFLFFEKKRLFLPIFFAILWQQKQSIESLNRAIAHFNLSFGLQPSKIICPLDCCLIQAVQLVYDAPVQTTHYFYVKYLHKLAHRLKLRGRRTTQ